MRVMELQYGTHLLQMSGREQYENNDTNPFEQP